MRFVYATRPEPRLEFATTNQREAIPTDADVYACCDGALTIRLDNQTSETMTQEEQFTLETLITQSQLAETKVIYPPLVDGRNFASRLLHRLLNW